MVTYQADPHAFHVFYIIFFHAFIENEVRPNASQSISLKSPDNWASKNQDKQFRSLEIFGGHITNPYYFYKIKSEARTTNGEVSVNAEAFGKALFYLGFRLDTDHPEKGKNIYSRQTAHDRFMLFVKDYRHVIERIKNADDAIEKNKIAKKYISLILKNDKPGGISVPGQTGRFYSLNGKYKGIQVQGDFEPEEVELVLFTADQNNITGTLTAHYKADGKHTDYSREFHISGKYFSEEHVALIYWNPDVSVKQNGVIRLTQSGNKQELTGHFWGYYDPVPASRGRCEGTLEFSKID